LTTSARLVRFTVTLEGFEDERSTHELRCILKALRRHGFRCVAVVEEAVRVDHRGERDLCSNDTVSAHDGETGKA
jgi:hypothetical protein